MATACGFRLHSVPRDRNMKHSIARFLHGKQRVYRFALYGLSEAGKTCLLAALNLARERNPAGYTCCRISTLPDVRPPPGQPGDWDVKTDPVAAFYAGSDKLSQAEGALRQQQ